MGAEWFEIERSPDSFSPAALHLFSCHSRHLTLTLDATSLEAVVTIKVCKSRKNSHDKVEFYIKGEDMCHIERRTVPEMYFLL